MSPPSHTPGTLQYFQNRKWDYIMRRTINGRPRLTERNMSHLSKGIEVRMTKNEFYAWCSQNWHVVERLVSEGKTPSIDRIDSNGHYELGNIQVLCLRENISKQD